MKQRKLLIISLLLSAFCFLETCKKGDDKVHFHGRVTSPCNGSPIAQASVEISRDYNSQWVGSTQSNNLGTVTTDNNGYYSSITDVPDDGTFREYKFFVRNSSGHYIGSASSTEGGTEITANVIIYETNVLSFHIKNLTPYNSNDQFDTLKIKRNDYSNNYYEYIFNSYYGAIKGMNVDTTIYDSTFWELTKIIHYCWTKNGISSAKDTTIHLTCATTKVDIYY